LARLELMNIDQFIQKRGIKQVKSARVEGRGGKLDAEGLFSEVIFGRVGTPTRRSSFGYIALNVKIIHPEIWDFIIGLNPLIGKMVIGRKNFMINEKGLLEEILTGDYGLSGIKDLIENWDKLDLSVLGKGKADIVKFLKKNRESIFIDKILVLPAKFAGGNKNKKLRS